MQQIKASEILVNRNCIVATRLSSYRRSMLKFNETTNTLQRTFKKLHLSEHFISNKSLHQSFDICTRLYRNSLMAINRYEQRILLIFVLLLLLKYLVFLVDTQRTSSFVLVIQLFTFLIVGYLMV